MTRPYAMWCLAVWLAVAGLPVHADETMDLRGLQASQLDADGFLGLVGGHGVGAICALPAVHDCLRLSAGRCRRGLERSTDPCLSNVKRLVRVTGVTGPELNATYLGDFASCVIDRAATAQLLELDAVHACLLEESAELALLWNGSGEGEGSRAEP